MKFYHLISYAIKRLQQAGIDSAHVDARILLGHVAKQSPEYIISHSNDNLSIKEYINFLNLVERRAKFEPIAYITGYQEFYSYQFAVNQGVLIPRPDTETIIDAVLAKEDINSSTPLNILELGVGSGCVIITLLNKLTHAVATATDIELGAIEIAYSNAKMHQVTDRVVFVHSDWFENIKPQKFDIIISNPPYISEHELIYMSPETMHEPRTALFSIGDGLASYQAIAVDARKFLAPRGKILVEVGFQQAVQVVGIFNKAGFNDVASYKDLAGHVRVIEFICG